MDSNERRNTNVHQLPEQPGDKQARRLLELVLWSMVDPLRQVEGLFAALRLVPDHLTLVREWLTKNNPCLSRYTIECIWDVVTRAEAGGDRATMIYPISPRLLELFQQFCENLHDAEEGWDDEELYRASMAWMAEQPGCVIPVDWRNRLGWGWHHLEKMAREMGPEFADIVRHYYQSDSDVPSGLSYEHPDADL
jgi:hypothetical protein